jgi:hypothetical protein
VTFSTTTTRPPSTASNQPTSSRTRQSDAGPCPASCFEQCSGTCFLAHARHPTPATTLIRVAGTRWKIEENNEQGKDLIGLDQHQVRTWTAWHHTITACMFAHAFLAVQHADLHTDTDTSAETDTETSAEVPVDNPGPQSGESTPPANTTGPDWLSRDLLTHTTVADVRNLLAQTVLHARHDRRHILCWAAWRLKHKVRARISHYLRRGNPLPENLRKWVKRPEVIQV